MNEWLNLSSFFLKKNVLLYSVPIFNKQSSVSAQLQLALEDSSGSLLTDAEEKLSDSLTAHTESERDRKRESLSVHMFIHPLRILFYVPTHSRLWLSSPPPKLPHSLLHHWFAGYYLLLFRTAVGTVAERNSSLKKTEKQGPLFQLNNSKIMLYPSTVLLSACVQGASDKKGWNSHPSWCVSAWAASVITCARVKWSWKTTMVLPDT